MLEDMALARKGGLIAVLAAEKQMSCLKCFTAYIPFLYVVPFLSCAENVPKSGCVDPVAIARPETADWDLLERQCLQALATTKEQPDQQPATYRVYLTLARLFERQHRFADAEQYYRSAHTLAKSAFGERSDSAANALYGLGTMRLQQGRSREAEVILHQVLSILESDKNANSLDIALTLNILAEAQHMSGNFSKAAALSRTVVHILETDPATDPVDLGTALSNLATMLRDTGNRPEAVAAAERAGSILECCRNTEHFAVNLALRGVLRLDEGDSAGAETLLLRALNSMEALGEQSSPARANVLTHLGSVYAHGGKHKEAESCFQRALEINRRLLAPDHPKLLESMGAYATLLRATKRKGEAKKLEAYIQAQRQKYQAENPVAANVVDVHSLMKQSGR
jgi:tetratricopeptide (TPR) repeat protein